MVIKSHPHRHSLARLAGPAGCEDALYRTGITVGERPLREL